MQHTIQWFGLLILFVFLPINEALKAQERMDRFVELPADSIVLASLDTESIRKDPEHELFPWEIFRVASVEQLGLDALTINSIDIAVGLGGPQGPEAGAVFRTEASVDIAELRLQNLGELQSSTKQTSLRFRQINNTPVRFAQIDPKRVFFGTEGMLRRMVSNKPQSSKALNALKENVSPICIVVAIEPIRPILIGSLEDNPGQFPQAVIRDLKSLLERVSVLRATATLGAEPKIQLDLHAESPQSTKIIEEALIGLLDSGIAMAESKLKSDMERDPSVSENMKRAVETYLARIKKLASQQRWTVKDDRLTIEIDHIGKTSSMGVVLGLLLPAVEAARKAAQRMESANHQRQIMLALHNYESAYRKMPNRVWKRDKDKPLLSWRVAILPFMEQVNLYEQFHLDEPWDSPHNIQLLDKMPAVFANPRAFAMPGHTTYVMPYGEGLPGSEEFDIDLGHITDGLSNTIAILEVNSDHAVPWTKPEDVNADEVDLRTTFLPIGSNVGIWDGSIRFLETTIDSQILEALLTHDGGELVIPN